MSSESADPALPVQIAPGAAFDFRAPLRLSDRLTLPGRVVLSPMQGVMTRTFLHAAAELDLIPFCAALVAFLCCGCLLSCGLLS